MTKVTSDIIEKKNFKGYVNQISKMLNLSKFVRFISLRQQSTHSKIVITNDKNTIVAWHPKQDFPYECTKALPDERFVETDTVLKTTVTPELLSIFNKKTPEQARQELMDITHTTKHRWFPRARDKRAKETPMDREYL
ncbi:unnamed protein product [Phyllotreta striolata]|uniref:Large ribosomal subunit protein mL42 n=1 Tax=Phyllotreta striolata TaxID=444603 RepID=A0A9N9TJR0_PHYSR|nr:unnamed protein product [Phyllotreta striolata]